MKSLPIFFITALIGAAPATLLAEECDPSRWTVTLETLEPLDDDERMVVVRALGLDLTLEQIAQAIMENQVPLSAFGGE